MARSNVRIKMQYRSNVSNLKRKVDYILNNRFDAVCQKLYKELQLTLSKKGPSKPGQPPGITQTPHSYRTPGGLMKSIGWTKDNKGRTIRRRIGSTLPRGFWLEVGVRGGVIIRPVRAKALMIPLSPADAARLLARKGRKINNKGKRRKGRKSNVRNNKLIGVIQHANGQWYALMRWVRQGPILPRPWLKPTMLKNLNGIGLTLGQRIN